MKVQSYSKAAAEQTSTAAGTPKTKMPVSNVGGNVVIKGASGTLLAALQEASSKASGQLVKKAGKKISKQVLYNDAPAVLKALQEHGGVSFNLGSPKKPDL